MKKGGRKMNIVEILDKVEQILIDVFEPKAAWIISIIKSFFEMV